MQVLYLVKSVSCLTFYLVKSHHKTLIFYKPPASYLRGYGSSTAENDKAEAYDFKNKVFKALGLDIFKSFLKMALIF